MLYDRQDEEMIGSMFDWALSSLMIWIDPSDCYVLNQIKCHSLHVLNS